MVKGTKKTKRPSMQDVADLAGVSTTTVSFVINQVPDSNIPQKTQDRIWAAVETLEYRPNALARGLRSQKTHTIGFISDEVATTPYAGRIILGAQERAWKHNYLLLLVNTAGNQEMKQAGIDMMLERQVDGIIYATMYHREANPPDVLHQVPTVLLDCYAKDRSLPSVVPDEVDGGQGATEYLLAKGHRRIGFINNVDPIPATYGRLEGYKAALAAHHIPYDEALVIAGESDARGGYECALEIMQRSDPPTALFCFNDRMAMGVYDALRKLNLMVPDDVGVIGFDDESLIAAQLYPGLTTMALPHYEMGQWAVQHLLELIDKPDGHEQTPGQHLIKCPLVERESV